MINTDEMDVYIRTFLARDPNGTFVPVSEFPSNTPFNLSWGSNGTYYQVYEKANPTPVYEGKDSTFLMKGIASATTFTLVAYLGQLVAYSSLTITVSNPVLSPESMEVYNDARVNGTLSARQTVSDAVRTSFLTVQDLSTLSRVNVTDSLTMPATIFAPNSSITGNVGINGKLFCQDSFNTSNADAYMFGRGSRANINETSPAGIINIAPADGFLLATVPPPAYIGSGATFGPVYDNASIGIWFEGATCWYVATGAYVKTAKGNGMDGGQWMCTPICIPLKRGTRWMYKLNNDNLNKQKIPGLLTWVPIGLSDTIINTANGANTSEDLMIPDFPETAAPSSNMQQNKKNKAVAFLNSLEKVIGKNIAVEDKHILSEQLMEI
ncbi:hypothetical protein CLV59_1142 [Chitinophaga dinghuensis]|uniref:Uncharacterized protein n=1 Tax=Chitinophaga dinghuensis TaxID=1539050 RepID=A0A327VJE5_9BACT|nr:hypothetical protein [Chitinophaga dinghuensis]RAJ72800.1 hypothetical protein CLV59_1142 [Chitinophaga dinghuensis]